MLGLALIIAYVFIKTSSVPRILFATAAYYLTFYFYASLPMFFQHISLGLFCLVSIEGTLWLMRYDFDGFLELIKNMHWLRALHYIAMCLLGFIMYSLYFPTYTTDLSTFVFAVISAFFAFEFALMANNLYDRERIVYGVEKSKALGLCLGLFSLSAAIFVNNTFLLIMITCTSLAFVYSAPPIRSKRFGYWNNALIGFESALAFAAGFTSQNPDIKLLPLNIFLTVFVIFSIAGNIKDLKDLKEDRKEGIKTIPVLLGREKAVKVLALLTSLCFPLSAAMLGLWNLLLIGVIFGFVNGLLLLKFKTEKTVFACYFGFLLVIGYWLLLIF